MNSILKQALSFALTLGIPLLYLQTLMVINATAHSISLLFEIIQLGIILSTIGVLLWISSFITLGSSFGVLPQKQKRVTKGVYKYLRHPMYIAIILTFFGLSLALESKEGFVFTTLVIFPLLAIRIYFEEKALIIS